MDNEKELTQQIEPTRRTFLDVLLENFHAANSRINYVHRLIYIGEHTFSEEPNTNIGEFMRQTIQTVNDEYHDEFLTGVFVYYPRYFCHVVEGSEDSIIKHLLLVTEDTEYSSCFGRIKLLMSYHHINQRFLQTWVAVTGKPPTLIERIDVGTDIYRTWRHVYNCIQKLYKLAMYQRPKISAVASSILEDVRSESTTSSYESQSTPAIEKSRTTTMSSFLTERYPDCLPEYGLLEFLLATPYTQSLQEYIKLYGVIQQVDAYKDKVWPVPPEFVPFHIFDKPFDPVTDLPTTTQEPTDAFKDVE